MVPGGSVDVRRGTIFDRSAPGSRLRCHPGHKRSATLDTASSNSWPFWYRSSGRLESDLRTTSSSGGGRPGLGTAGRVGGGRPRLGLSGEGGAAPGGAEGGRPAKGRWYKILAPGEGAPAAAARPSGP